MSKLSDEEKKAIDELKVLIGLEEFNKLSYKENQSIKIILNLIEIQQKEIEGLKETLKCTQNSWYEDTKIIEELKANQIIFANDYRPIGSKGRKFISEDKIKAFIKEELPDDEIMETCQNYDSNGVLIREKLEELLKEE